MSYGRQYRRMGLAYLETSSQCYIRARNKRKQIEIVFFFYRMPDSCIVFRWSKTSDPENDIALYRIPYFNDHRPEWVRRTKKIGTISQSPTVSARFVGELNTKMTSQSKLDLFSRIVVHRPKEPKIPCFERVQHLMAKILGQKRFRHRKQGCNESSFMRKKFSG